MRGEYKTRQRQLILEYLKSRTGQHITVDSVAEYLGGKVGRTTVYRNLESLAAAGAVVKFESAGGGSACYSLCDSHDKTFHFLCIDCGKIFHINCNHLKEFSNHMKADHGMKVDLFKTVIYGCCEKCSASEDKNA